MPEQKVESVEQRTSRLSHIENNPYSNYGLLAFIGSTIERFSSLRDLNNSIGLNTATLFTPQVIAMLDGEIARNPNIIHDSYLVIDLINIYSFETTGDINVVFDSLVGSIVKTRGIGSTDNVISEEALDHYTVTDTDGLSSLLYNNKVLVALYVYILVTTIF